MTQNTTQSVLFPSHFSKPVLAAFDQPDSSSDGGEILQKRREHRSFLIQMKAFAAQQHLPEVEVFSSTIWITS